MKRIYASGKFSAVLEVAVDVEDGMSMQEAANAIDEGINLTTLAEIKRNLTYENMEFRMIDHKNLPTIGGQ